MTGTQHLSYELCYSAGTLSPGGERVLRVTCARGELVEPCRTPVRAGDPPGGDRRQAREGRGLRTRKAGEPAEDTGRVLREQRPQRKAPLARPHAEAQLRGRTLEIVADEDDA